MPKSVRHPEDEPVVLNLKSSSSYPTMIRARTANKNRIQKRNSEISVIVGGMGPCAAQSFERNKSNLKKRKFLKKSVHCRATRRKSLENLGLVVRNRCGTAKLHWPSEKKESDVFDLLPEGCIQVRSLSMTKSPSPKIGENEVAYGLKGGNEGNEDMELLDANFKLKHNSSSSSPPCQGHHKIKVSNAPNISFGINHGSGVEVGSAGGKTDWKQRRNISVIVRIRPKQARELKEKSIVFRTDSKTVLFDPKEKTKDFYFQGVKQSTRNDFGRKRPNRNVTFQYDRVYGPEATNRQIFGEMLEDLTEHLIEGYNSTVFAYGATGSGKTYTMIGSNENPGLTVLMVESLYKRLEELAPCFECDVVCSYLEVYNETIKDLLHPEKELSIREDGKKGIIIPDLTFYKPRGPSELLRLLRNGNRARTQHATDLNSESSRSHAVFEVKLSLKRKRRSRDLGLDHDSNDLINDNNDDMDGGLNKVEVIHSKLVMVDLAGSERGTAALASGFSGGGGGMSGGSGVGTHHHHHHHHQGGGLFMQMGGFGARQREGASINKSLLALANCISALADGKCHIPYRNSKLTRLLKDALSGNCTTVMIANISPSALTSEDTYNTLKYADRAKSIVGPGIKQKNVFLEDLIMEDCVKSQVAELQAKLEHLTEMLEEEKLKNELMMKEQERLKEENACMNLVKEKNAMDGCEVDERWTQDRGIATNKNNNKNSTTSCNMNGNVLLGLGGGDADAVPFLLPSVVMKSGDENLRQVFHQNGADGERCWNSNSNGGNREESGDSRLPEDIKKYVEIAGERARIFSEYVEFASKQRLEEWALSCKKLKCDIGDFMGRLAVTDKNYVSFCKLKNEVNNLIRSNSNSGSNNSNTNNNKSSNRNGPDGVDASLFASENYIETCRNHHRKYAVKLKNLTEKLELVRREVISNSLKSMGKSDSRGIATSAKGGEEKVENEEREFGSKAEVKIALEDFLLFKRLLGEQEGNDKMEQFYQLFCQEINNQLVNTERTLTLALKLVKTMYLKLQQSHSLPPVLEEDYKELADFVYGPGPPPLPAQTPPLRHDESHVPDHLYHPNHLHNNKAANDNFRSVSDTSILSAPAQAPPPPPTRLTSVPVVPLAPIKSQQGANLGRKSSPILDDLSTMKKLVDEPLLVQLTTLLLEEEDEESQMEDDEDDLDDVVDENQNYYPKVPSKQPNHQLPHQQQIIKNKPGTLLPETVPATVTSSGVCRTSRRSKGKPDTTSSIQFILTPKTSRSSTSDKTYRKSKASSPLFPLENSVGDEEDDGNVEDDEEEEDDQETKFSSNKAPRTQAASTNSCTSDENDELCSDGGSTETYSDSFH